MPRSTPSPLAEGLGGLRRGGAVTELLFLYECTTLEPTQLRPIADALGLTVQAVSHSYRALARRGLVELREGRYRPTVRGVATLHESLGRLGEEVRARLDRLHVIRSCRAIALAPVTVGQPVSLELVDGLLSARPGGAGASRGRVVRGGRRGALIEVGDLEGIVPLVPGAVHVRTLTDDDLRDERLPARLRAALKLRPGEVVGAHGLEAYHAVRAAAGGPVVRFAVAAAAQEASRLGVDSTVFVMANELPRFLAEFGGTRPPTLDVTGLFGRRGR